MWIKMPDGTIRDTSKIITRLAESYHQPVESFEASKAWTDTAKRIEDYWITEAKKLGAEVMDINKGIKKVSR